MCDREKKIQELIKKFSFNNSINKIQETKEGDWCFLNFSLGSFELIL